MTISTVAVCCDDLGLMADARRLCATAGLEVEVAGVVDAHRWWPTAGAVLVDVVAAGQLTAQGLPRRPRVALVSRDDEPHVWRAAVLLGAEQVAALPLDETAVVRGVLSGRAASADAPVVACVPATGGAGASTVAAGLALAAARQGSETLLVDCDQAGGGLDLLLGAEHAPGLRWPDVAALDPDTPADVVLEAMVRPAQRLWLLSCGRSESTADVPRVDWPSAPLVSLGRAGVDLVVLDLPRPVVDVPPPAADVALLVVRAGVRQTVAATAIATRLRAAADDVRLVVRGASRGGLSAAEISAAVGVPLAIELPHDRRIALAADDGQLARALTRMPFDSLATTVRAALDNAA